MVKQNIGEELNNLIKPISVLYLSSYIPRKCGIATFTKDLTNAINMLNPSKIADIAALDNDISTSLHYPHEVKFRLYENENFDYKELAYRLKTGNNENNYDLISLQHEYGIYGKNDGEEILEFIDLMKKPIVTTLYTVLENPSANQEKILGIICNKSRFLVVMLSNAKNILVEKYGVDRNKIVVIHHGVPDFPKLEAETWKRKIKLSKYTIMSSINLISPSKGLEFAIQAVPGIVKKIPNFLYLIIGETHPVYLKKNNGNDVYRKKLKKLVKDLSIGKHVRFVNQYLSIKSLMNYVGASDFYITPYLDAQQAASGALAYGIGAGKVCISTPYLYAQEMLGKLRGILVPFKDSESVAEAVVRVMRDSKERELYETNSYLIGRTMTWNNVAHQYLHLFKYAINGYH